MECSEITTMFSSARISSILALKKRATKKLKMSTMILL
jgi:hypothetical protein